jgi:hypothetical protein
MQQNYWRDEYMHCNLASLDPAGRHAYLTVATGGVCRVAQT